MPGWWTEHADEYAHLINSTDRDSRFLRQRGLKPTLVRMAGNCSDASVLDAGCGDGWLLDALAPREGHGCDLCRFDKFPARWQFREGDVRGLSYSDGCFDVTVASLVLIWFPELDRAMSELCRVTKHGGRVVLAIMNPYFYRTGRLDEDGRFALERNLASPFVLEDHRIAGVVGPFAYHYRPLPVYLNACVLAGLVIEEVADWHIDMDAFVEHFETAKPGNIERTGDVPMYTFIKCRREPA